MYEYYSNYCNTQVRNLIFCSVAVTLTNSFKLENQFSDAVYKRKFHIHWCVSKCREHSLTWEEEDDEKQLCALQQIEEFK